MSLAWLDKLNNNSMKGVKRGTWMVQCAGWNTEASLGSVPPFQAGPQQVAQQTPRTRLILSLLTSKSTPQALSALSRSCQQVLIFADKQTSEVHPPGTSKSHIWLTMTTRARDASQNALKVICLYFPFVQKTGTGA